MELGREDGSLLQDCGLYVHCSWPVLTEAFYTASPVKLLAQRSVKRIALSTDFSPSENPDPPSLQAVLLQKHRVCFLLC
ncbi:unnamed protein product [Coccothraustes coccothraustes]